MPSYALTAVYNQEISLSAHAFGKVMLKSHKNFSYITPRSLQHRSDRSQLGSTTQLRAPDTACLVWSHPATTKRGWLEYSGLPHPLCSLPLLLLTKPPQTQPSPCRLPGPGGPELQDRGTTPGARGAGAGPSPSTSHPVPSRPGPVAPLRAAPSAPPPPAASAARRWAGPRRRAAPCGEAEQRAG